MKRTAVAVLLGRAAGLPVAASAEPGHEAHHPAPLQEQAALPTDPTAMQAMPEQCRTMMQTMPAECMTAMQQMMRGEMRNGAMNASVSAKPTAGADSPKFTRAYVEAMDAMPGPMMEGSRPMARTRPLSAA